MRRKYIIDNNLFNFFLIEEKFFKIKLEKISSNKSTKKILEKINKQIYEYFEIKILTSFFTGTPYLFYSFSTV